MRTITFSITFHDDDLILFAKSFKDTNERNVIIKFAVREYIRNHPDYLPYVNQNKQNMTVISAKKTNTKEISFIQQDNDSLQKSVDTDHILGFLK